tara:strand:- start:128 stop:421 length:294 start_codon:yes stop_codon:yes gene_type:complete
MKYKNSKVDNSHIEDFIKSFDTENTFDNWNQLKKLADEINITDIVNPTYETYSKLMELVSRAKNLKEFEILPDGDSIYKNTSMIESPEGAGQVRVKT